MGNSLDFRALEAATVKNEPFPYFKVEQSLLTDDVSQLIQAFPQINDGGSYNLDDVEVLPAFQQLIDSIDSDEFRRIISEKLDVQVADLPIMVTLRGYSRQKDGRIHTDSKTKVATILIYFNEGWEAPTGRLRILRNGHDMDDYADEVLPGAGNLLAFKVTDNCWHGYPSFDGKRQSIQINFLTSEAAGNKHRFFHGLSAKLKTLFK